MKNTWKWIKTSAVLLATFNAGFNLGIFSPTVPDIQTLTSSTTAQMSNTLVWIGIAGIIGAILLGPLYDMIDGLLILMVSLAIQGICFGAAPFFTVLSGYQIILAAGFLFNVGLLTGTMSTNCIIWQEQPNMVGPILQTTDLMHVLGTALAPQVISPFLSKSNFSANAKHAKGQEASNDSSNTNGQSSPGLKLAFFEDSNISSSANFDPKFAEMKMVRDASPMFSEIKPVQIAYLITAAFDMTVAFYCLVIFVMDKTQNKYRQKKRLLSRRRHYSTSSSAYTTHTTIDNIDFSKALRRKRSISVSNRIENKTDEESSGDLKVEDASDIRPDNKIREEAKGPPNKDYNLQKKSAKKISRKMSLDVIEISPKDLAQLQEYIDKKSKQIKTNKDNTDKNSINDINDAKPPNVKLRKSFEEEIKKRRNSLRTANILQIENNQSLLGTIEESTSENFHHQVSSTDIQFDNDLEDDAPKLACSTPTTLFIAMVLGFFVTNGGRDGMMTGLLYTYVETFLDWEPINGTILVTVYHLTRVLIHSVFVYLANKISPFHLTVFNCAVLVCGGGLMFGTATNPLPIFTYFSVILTGVATSNIHPTAITLVRKSILVTGRIMGILFAAMAGGQIVFAPLLGFFFERRGAVAFPAMLFLTSVLTSLLFVPWYFIAKRVKRFYEEKRRNKFDASEWYRNLKMKRESEHLGEKTPLRNK